ncbi:MAG: DEAD/DEAH box helicase [Spirochaetaceae bacterium]|jgi:ATP-dependent RNA helicase RhlB|nr:DEAD/DEAH box helicase [Spirochaetaceae bacterium]
MEFQELNLHPDIQRGITEAGYITCMPVQEQVLANAFRGQDLYVQSQTGTGKTAAFLVVIFQRLLTEVLLNGKKAIIMVPTRELAVQVEEEAKLLGKYLPFKIGSFYGGVGYTEQQKMLRDNVQILVGTPGRVLDLNSSGQMNLMDIAFLILDEADRMFDMGFYPDLRKLIKVVPPVDRRQTMLFSATLNNWVKNLAWEYTKNPLEIEITPENVTVEEIDQMIYHVPSDDKMKLLLGIMAREKPESAIIFCNTKRYAEIVAKRLRINGIDCEFIMGDLPQSKRLRIIDDVKAGRIRFLVATDVAARGLDIESLAMVVNYDLPVETENYVHRIGRTARAGKTGKAVTLASEQDVYELPAIEKYIGKKIPSEISSEELYAEDKSEGMRIHTDFFGLRGGDRDSGRRGGAEGFRGSGGRGWSRGGRQSGGGGPYRENGRGAGGPDQASDRPRGDRDRPREDRGRGRRETGGRDQDRARNREKTAEPPVRGFGEGRQTPRGAAPADRELSHLSFDERMAYYKQKYDSPAAQKAPEKGLVKNRDEASPPVSAGPRPGRQPGRGNRPRGAGSGRRGKAEGAAGPRERPGDAAGGERRPGGKNPRSRNGGQRPPKSAAPGAALQSPEAAAPKKGIIGKLLGIFKKGPSS